MKARLAKLGAWLDDRSGFRKIRGVLLDEPLPPGTGWWFTLGSVVLFGLIVQTATGIALALYYAPTPDHAWDSVRYISTEVRGGRLIRGLHHWGASLVVLASVAHVARVVYFGSYRKPREPTWIVGLVLLSVILGLGLTGYLLPWDQRAYWATVVTINISTLVPIVGDWAGSLLRGGPDVGALTLTRWYAAHVILLPAVLAALVVVHLYLIRRHGVSGPVRPRAGDARPFFPHQAARDLAASGLSAVLLVGLAWMGAPELEPPADPSASGDVPRPDWYFLWLFQLLKYFPGRLEVVGAILVPGLILAWLALLPWLDRSGSREWKGRRRVLGAFTAGGVAVVTLTLLGARDSPAPRSTAWNVRELAGAALVDTEGCRRCHAADGMAAPIVAGRIGRAADWLAVHVADPEVIGPGIRPVPPANDQEVTAILAALARMRGGPPPGADEATARVYLTVNRFCLACHTIGGVGGREGPNLTTVGRKLDARAIERRMINPKAEQPDAEMPAFAGKLTPDEIREVARWLAAQK